MSSSELFDPSEIVTGSVDKGPGSYSGLSNELYITPRTTQDDISVFIKRAYIDKLEAPVSIFIRERDDHVSFVVQAFDEGDWKRVRVAQGMRMHTRAEDFNLWLIVENLDHLLNNHPVMPSVAIHKGHIAYEEIPF
jgi:hypothetical protein